jgi:glucan phosphoethanolaminetransferase (alkaline phosphatase superfamily)
MNILDSVNEYFDERPLVALVFYLLLLIFLIWDVNTRVKDLKEKERHDIWTILILLLALLGVSHIFRTTKEIVTYEKKAVDKYIELRKRKKELNSYIITNIKSENVDQPVLQEKALELHKINAEIQYLENKILTEQDNYLAEQDNYLAEQEKYLAEQENYPAEQEN